MLIDLRVIDHDTQTFDVVVIGAGGAGMTAALCAATKGARVLLVERTDCVGGTTAWSAGTTWVPCTSHAASVSDGDTIENAEAYLTRAIGDRSPAALRRAFLEHGARAIAHIEANSEVRFRACPLHPDYLSEIEGSTLKGRALEPLPFDGRRLGDLFALVRPPIPEFTVLDGMMVDRNDLRHLMRLGRSVISLRHAAKLVARHLLDRLRYPRGTRLVMGNALVGRLLLSLSLRQNVSLVLETSVERIRVDTSGVSAVTLASGAERRTVRVRGGVILASGGFNRNPRLRSELLPGADPTWCAGAPGHTGEAHELALALGARHGTGGLSNAFWAPVSLRVRPDGTTAVFPHLFMDRAKPGFIAVDRAGRRFVNESTSYHQFALRMQEPGSDAIPAFLLADHGAVRKYGIGIIRPGAKRVGHLIADGYLTRAESLADLAIQLGIDPATLAQTVQRFNGHAVTGADLDLGRGKTAYERNLGDSAWTGENPSLGPLLRPPFYAVRLYPGDIAAATGLVTDAKARVQDKNDRPIGGLYAVGNDMHSVMGGVYVGPGITLGPALVFGYIAGRHAARRAKLAPATTPSAPAMLRRRSA